MHLDIPYLLKHLTLEEKAGLCSGADNWWTKAVQRLGIPAIMVSDGPHGLRTQTEQVNGRYVGAVPAICFPSGSALASSFDADLLEKVGSALGEEAAGQKVHTVLGPAVNMKRSPLCGRNFEYLSEDPYLAGKLAASYIKGVQKHGVGVSLKHFAANNQEKSRMNINEHVDERTLREIYLAAFEIAVKEGNPWTVMASYNRINGTYSCENPLILRKILREQWGFDGVVMTDWGGMNRRVEAHKAALDLEMPGPSAENDRRLAAAVRDGSLDVKVLDESVARILSWIDKGLHVVEKPYDREAHHAFARKVEEQCAVLLKNDGRLLPLPSFDKVLFVAPFAQNPRYQGGGSSHINATRIESALEDARCDWLPGWGMDNETPDPKALAAVLEAAGSYQTVVVYAGMPDSFESEGYDRSHMDLPACQNELIGKLAEIHRRVVVVLHVGSPVAMPWKDSVGAILNMYLGGQAVGGATVDLLVGKANPSGKLAESFPLRLEDTPCYLDYGRDGHDAYYGEGLFIGYRAYDTRRQQVAFPFGYGLSYTTFRLGALKLSSSTWKEGDTLSVTVEVENTGDRDGAEVVQLYIAPKHPSVARPVHELKGFQKVFLKKGERREVSFLLDKRSFAYWDTYTESWHAERGAYGIELGTSSRDIALTGEVTVLEEPHPVKISDTTTIRDILESGWRYPKFEAMMEQLASLYEQGDGEERRREAEMHRNWVLSTPLHTVSAFMGIPYEQILKALE